MSMPLAAAIIGVLVAGCASGRRHFELGLYDVPPEQFGMAREAGFDIVVTRVTEETLNGARKWNLKVLGSAPANREVLRRFDRDPSLWGWYLPDEPDRNFISPAEMIRSGRQIRAAGGHKPRVVVLSSGRESRSYALAADILMVDSYPIPWAPLALVSYELGQGKLGSGDRPFYAILQAFGWSGLASAPATLRNAREPTAQELRCMTYIALAMEVQGIFYYTFKADSWLLSEHALWLALQGIVVELRSREALFTAEQPWFRKKVRYVKGEESGFNQLGEERVLFKILRVKRGDERTAPGDYLLAINTSEEKTEVQLRLRDYDLTEVSEFRAERIFAAKGKWLDLSFDPLEVTIIGPLHFSSSDSPPRR
jgi:hypothetical protein